MVVQATNVDQAWSILRDPSPPQIALLAWELSGLDLVLYCSQKAPDSGAKPIHAALILPRGGQPELTAGLMNGARGFVHRPLVIAEVLALVDTLLKLAQAENQNQELSGRVQSQTEKDPVTGALVWDHFFELSDSEFKRSLRYNNPLSVLMLEVCGAWGQPKGEYAYILDESMQAVAEVMLNHLRESDILGRIGQHEFAATLPQTDLIGATELAARLKRSLMGIRVGHGQWSQELEIKVGAAQLDESSANMGTLLLRAEGAMNEAESPDESLCAE